MTIKKMNPEAKELWVEALESDRYRQICGDVSQTSENGNIKHMCVMGVLNHVYAIKHKKLDKYGMPKGSLASDDHHGAVLKWAGIDKNTVDEMIERNDSRKTDSLDDVATGGYWSFKRFAAHIKKTL